MTSNPSHPKPLTFNTPLPRPPPQKNPDPPSTTTFFQVYDIDDDYWGAIYAEPKQDKKKKKSKAAAEETPAPAPSPAPTPQDAAAGGAQPVPLPQEGQPLVDPTMPSYTGYDISVRQISQDVLPQAPHSPNTLPGCPAFFKPTDVLAYGPANVPGTPFHAWPAYTIEAQVCLCLWGLAGFRVGRF